MVTPRRTEARTKYARIKSAMEAGRAHGETYGKIPLISPIFGAVRGWAKESFTLFSNDLTGGGKR